MLIGNASGVKKMMTNLVELKSIEQVVQLSILGSLVDLDEVLLEPVEGQFRFIIDIDL